MTAAFPMTVVGPWAHPLGIAPFGPERRAPKPPRARRLARTESLRGTRGGSARRRAPLSGLRLDVAAGAGGIGTPRSIGVRSENDRLPSGVRARGWARYGHDFREPCARPFPNAWVAQWR